jgi:hypothetical protein
MPLQKEKMDCFVAALLAMTVQQSPSLRAQRSNPSRRAKKEWIASSLRSSQ